METSSGSCNSPKGKHLRNAGPCNDKHLMLTGEIQCTDMKTNAGPHTWSTYVAKGGGNLKKDSEILAWCFILRRSSHKTAAIVGSKALNNKYIN
jgi:hypothetical protein